MNIDPLTGVIAVSVAVVIVALLCYSPPPADIHDIGPGATPRKISSADGRITWRSRQKRCGTP
jgi:hypothetical protein